MKEYEFVSLNADSELPETISLRDIIISGQEYYDRIIRNAKNKKIVHICQDADECVLKNDELDIEKSEHLWKIIKYMHEVARGKTNVETANFLRETYAKISSDEMNEYLKTHFIMFMHMYFQQENRDRADKNKRYEALRISEEVFERLKAAIELEREN